MNLPVVPSKLKVAPGRRRAARSASWMALVAATGLGAQFDCLEAEISAGEGAVDTNDQGLRLVVQSFAADQLDAGGKLTPGARPLSATQRVVTPEELAAGVPVRLVRVAEDEVNAAVLLAWVEPGDADLEYEGLRATPGQDALQGQWRDWVPETEL